MWQPLLSTTTRSSASGFQRYTHVPGDGTIEVLYDPSDPDHFYTNSFFALWPPAVLFIAGGLLLMGMATAVEMGYPVLEPFAMIFALIARSGRLRFGR